MFQLLYRSAAHLQNATGEARDREQRVVVEAFEALGVTERELRSAAVVLPGPLHEDWPWHRDEEDSLFQSDDF